MNNKMMRMLLGIAGILVFAASASAQMETWQNDPPHTFAYFQVRHNNLNNIRGSFHKMKATVQYDPSAPGKTVINATIDASTIDTDFEARDKDLRSADYFAVDKFPSITFKSTSVEPAGPGKLKVNGDLTIRDVTKPVVMNVDGPTAIFKDANGKTHMGATGRLTINRKDFGITINPAISDDVIIALEMDLVKPMPPAAGSN